MNKFSIDELYQFRRDHIWYLEDNDPIGKAHLINMLPNLDDEFAANGKNNE